MRQTVQILTDQAWGQGFFEVPYCQKLVTRVSGGAFDLLFSVLEFDPLDDLGEVV